MSAFGPPVEHDPVFKRYMAALLEGDSRGLSAIINRLLAQKTPLSSIYQDYIQRGMYEVGALWECNQIPVSVEHLSASATQMVLIELYLTQQCTRKQSPEVMIACVANELHDVGIMIVANLCEAAGWKSITLGANTPTKDMLTYIGNRQHMPHLLALSITMPANRATLENDLGAITTKFPTLKIVIGGQALGGCEDAIRFRENLLAKYPTVHYMQTLGELEHFLTELAVET